MKNIYFIILALLIVFYIVSSVRKNQLSIKTSFIWIMSSLLMLILACFPKSLDWLAVTLGISYPPALFLMLCVVYLIIQNFNFSKKIADLQEKITDIAQELAIIKDEVKINKK